MTSSLPLLRTLVDIISSGVKDIEDTCARKNLEFPGLDGAFEGTQDIEATKDVPEVAQAICTIVAAASHLTALVQPAQTSMMAAIMQFNVSAALFTAEALSVTEVLRDVGNTASGMNVVDIASHAGTSPKKLAHALRLLATEHIYKESLLDSGKPLSEVLDPSKDKYTAPCSPMPVMVQGFCESAKLSTHMPVYMSTPSIAFSDDLNKTLFNMVNKTELTFFEYLGLPENAHIRQRFGIAMGTQSTLTMNGFDWHSVPESAIVVDVGGGVGRASLPIARTCHKLKINVQDLPNLENDMHNIIQFWKAEFPEALISGRVKFQVQDFFGTQHVQGADVYLLRSILHDWSDVYCAKILNRLREAARPRSKLVVVDAVLSYAVQSDDGVLLANSGHANLTGHAYSVHMINGQERTLPEFERLFEESGWRLESVKRPDMSYQSFIVAVPSDVPMN
ncbi:O-methyltransferase [Mucidula mucida]|nr:O-methyltransferase [Mucidula mucida]